MRGSWTCRWCGRTNITAERSQFCGHCWNGRTQAIEDMVADKVGLPRRRLVRGGSR